VYDGSWEAGNSSCLCELIPGNYYVTEAALAGWEAADITGDDPAVVAAGDTCGVNATVVTVTNAPIPGCLEVT